MQKVFFDLGYKEGSFLISSSVSKSIFSMSFYPYLGKTNRDLINELLVSL